MGTVLTITVILSAILFSMGLGVLAIVGCVNLIARFIPK